LRIHVPYGIGVRTFKDLLRDSEAAEIAEAAVVLPIVFLFIFAILWFGLAFKTWGTVTSAAREGARYASRPTCATCTPASTLPTDSSVDSAVAAVLQTSGVDPSKIITYPPPVGYYTPCLSPPAPPSSCSGPTAHKLTICRFVMINFGNSPQQCGTLVSFQYPFGSGLPFPTYPNLSLQSVTISVVGSSQTQN